MKKIGKGIFFFLVIAIAVASGILTRNLGDLDEIWNFNFANQMAKGLVPYRDFNMVQTPLLPMIVSLFLKVFGTQLLVTRILGVFLGAGILFMAYHILKKLKVNLYIRLTTLLIFFLLLKNNFALDYNFAVLLLVLFMIALELKKRKIEKNGKRQRYDLLIGFLAGLCICFKQSTGAFILLATLVIGLWQEKKKGNWKQYLTNVVIRIIGAVIPVAILFIYLLVNGALGDFINYAVLGIQTFSNHLAYTTLFQNTPVYIKLLAVLFPLTLIFMFFVTWKAKNKKIGILTAYGIATAFTMYPITDEIHFLIGALPTFIGFVYILHIVIRRLKIGYQRSKTMRYIRDFCRCALWLALFIFLGIALEDTISYIKSADQYQDLPHYSYIRVTDKLEGQIKNVSQYIQNASKPVYILDSDAAIYRIPTDGYEKDYDMFLKGNLGIKGEEGQIEKLESTQDKILLIKNDATSLNWQNPEKVRQYVKENYTKVGEIEYFDIYE